MKTHHWLLVLAVVGVAVFLVYPTFWGDVKSGKLHLGPLHWPTSTTVAPSGLVNEGSLAPTVNAS